MSETKYYAHEEFEFDFTPNGSPYIGILVTRSPELEPYTAEVNLLKPRSCAEYANRASKLCGTESEKLQASLNSICSKRHEEVTAAKKSAQSKHEVPPEEEADEEEIDCRVGRPGVLERLVEDAATFSRVVREKDMLKLLMLGASSAQLELLPNGKPIGTNTIITAGPGRGKNYLCDAVARLLPESFYFAFESASAKSLYYRAGDDSAFLKHRWVYPNEAEATDLLVEMFRPLLSGGLAKHLTVNSESSGRSTSQEFTIEGPITLTIPTVRNKIDSQLQSRMLVAGLEDYEGRVADHSGAVSGLLSKSYVGTDYTDQIRAWQAALKSLTGIRRVTIPKDHPDFRFDSDQVSYGARLWGNVLGLMSTHAWLEQRNRNIVELPGEERAIEATPEDYEAAYEVFKATCDRSVVNLSDIHRKMLDAVYALTAEAKEKDDTDFFFSPGFAQRSIEDMSRRLHGRAYVRQSSISENKTFLVKSAKLMWEPPGGGLALVKGSEPSWWVKGDALDGFPKPEQVRIWWAGDGPPTPKPYKSDLQEGEQNDREACADDRQGADHEIGLRKPIFANKPENIGNIGMSEASEGESSLKTRLKDIDSNYDDDLAAALAANW